MSAHWLCRSRVVMVTSALVVLLGTSAACSSPNAPSAGGRTPPSSSGGPSTPPATGGSTTPGAPAPSSRPAQEFTVTSSLDGHTALPHRIRWIARPNQDAAIPGASVEEVDFLIDGRTDWIEHDAPYSYGEDGNYLVTSFLKPGPHELTVKAVDSDGQTATDSVTATVSKAPAPPSALAGTWKAPEPSSPPTIASLVVTSEGWYMGNYPVTHVGGNRVDVAYLAPGLVEVRTGMATGHDHVVGRATDDDLNGWCNDAPGSPARYRWSVAGTHLHFTFVSGKPCEGFTRFMKSAWTRAA